VANLVLSPAANGEVMHKLVITIPLAIGIAAALMGLYLRGFLAAVAIPKSFFDWFEQWSSIGFGLSLVAAVELFLSIGITLFIGAFAAIKWFRFNPQTICLVVYVGFLIACIPSNYHFFAIASPHMSLAEMLARSTPGMILVPVVSVLAAYKAAGPAHA